MLLPYTGVRGFQGDSHVSTNVIKKYRKKREKKGTIIYVQKYYFEGFSLKNIYISRSMFWSSKNMLIACCEPYITEVMMFFVYLKRYKKYQTIIF